MTQGELSRQSGVSRGHLSRIEIGSYKSCNFETLEKLAKGLNISLSSLSHIMKGRESVIHQETSEELLDRLRLAHPVGIPVYTEFPFRAGESAEPTIYVYRDKKLAKTSLEGYLLRDSKLLMDPEIKDGDVIIVDREGEINNGNIVACLVDGELRLGKLRKISGDLWLENNKGDRIRFADCKAPSVVIELIRGLK